MAGSTCRLQSPVGPILGLYKPRWRALLAWVASFAWNDRGPARIALRRSRTDCLEGCRPRGFLATSPLLGPGRDAKMAPAGR